MNQNAPVDQQALALTHAIALQESSKDGSTPDYNAVGDNGTSHGAYQWQPGNFESAAKNAGLDPNDHSPENQDKVAYAQVKTYKDQGYDPGQISSLWNSGSPNNWHDHSGTTIINGKPISYDTPKYVQGVKNYYQKLATNNQQSGTRSASQADSNGYHTTPAFTNAPGTEGAPEAPEEGLADSLKGRLSDASTALSSAATGKINPLSGVLQTVGAGAGAIGDTVNAGLKLIPGVKQAEGLLGKGISKLAGTGAGQAVTSGIGTFAANHPELAGDIGAVGNIAGVAGLATGAGALKDAVGGAVGKALGKEAISATVADLTPEISAGTKAGAKGAIKNGLSKSAITGEVSRVADPFVKQVAETVEDAVPKFQKLKTFTDKFNAVDDAIGTEADALRKSLTQDGVNPIVTPESYQKFTEGITRQIEEDPSLVGDSGQYAQRLLKQFESFLPKEGDITMENVLDARQKLDQAALKYKPSAFDKQGAFNDGLRAVRDGANQLLDESAPNAGVKASLRKQSLLYRARDLLAKKADAEVGTTKLTRFASRHPVIKGVIKAGGKKALEGLGLAAGYKTYEGLTGN